MNKFKVRVRRVETIYESREIEVEAEDIYMAMGLAEVKIQRGDVKFEDLYPSDTDTPENEVNYQSRGAGILD